MNAGGAGVERRDHGSDTPWSVAITIPARNEAERLANCLDAAATSLKDRGGIVVAVNGSSDNTSHIARDWFSRHGVPGILLNDAVPPHGSGVGRARRIAVEACRSRLAPDAAIMTTDADTCVAPDWVAANLSELRLADLICGTVLPHPVEHAELPTSISQHDSVEGEYTALTLLAQNLLDPLPHDPRPAHLSAPGASLAFRLNLYEDIGGFADVTLCEDRLFAAAAEARDWRVRRSAKSMVVTSCRLDGRTSGGMAGALRARITEPDPVVDEALLPAAQTILRAQLRGALRQRFAMTGGFGAAWLEVERQTALLHVPRLRLSDLKRELPLLRAEIGALTMVPQTRSA